MKIAVMLTRPWSAIHRFRSLLVNAIELGHEVFCMGPRAFEPNVYDLTKLALADLGLDLLPVSTQGPYVTDQWDLSAVEPTLDRINPDIVIGECINVPFEWTAQGWAHKHKKPGLLLSHATPLHTIPGWILNVQQNAPNSISLLSCQSHYQGCIDAGLKAALVGLPDLDLVRDDYDTDMTRKKLGCYGSQPLIIFFEHFAAFRSDPKEIPEYEAKVMTQTLYFFAHAQKADWRVIIHLHPEECRQKDSEGPEALTYSWRYPFLKAMQDLGGQFISDITPGRIGKLDFQYCDSFEAMAASNCLVGTAPEIADKANVIGKWYINLLPLSLHDSRYDEWLNLLVDTTTSFEVISATIRGPAFQPNPVFLEKWFYKVDKQTWQRILNVMEELHEKPQG